MQVTRDVRTILDDLTKTNHEAAERWQAVAVERLNQLVSVWWDAATVGSRVVGRYGKPVVDEEGEAVWSGPDKRAHDEGDRRALRELHRVQGLHLDTVVNMQTNVVMDAAVSGVS